MGLPLRADGRETDQSRKTRHFSKLLKVRTKKPVEFVNEYRSTEDIKTEEFSLGINKIRHKKIDHLSAALILKDYYSRQE